MSDAAGYLDEARRRRMTGDWYTATTAQRRAIALLRGGDPAALAHAVRQLADMLVEAGRADEAETPVAEALALYRAMPEAPALDLANALRGAAAWAEATGDDETAAVFWSEARSRYAALDVVDGVAEADARLAALRG